jgi:cell wall-associated NlpC family hydrolase
MGSLVKNARDRKKGYQKVILPDGKRGWLDRYSLRPLDGIVRDLAKMEAVDLEQTGLGMMGVPYLWGGTSAKAVDCSGFTKTILWMNGCVFPRDASQQVSVGKKVPINDSLEHLLPGDLIYFGRLREDGSQKITHVALHLGNRHILHASGKVKMESLNPADSLFSEYRFNTMLTARRILGKGNIESVQAVKTHPWYY